MTPFSVITSHLTPSTPGVGVLSFLPRRKLRFRASSPLPEVTQEVGVVDHYPAIELSAQDLCHWGVREKRRTGGGKEDREDQSHPDKV
jgi:hypothetical protein